MIKKLAIGAGALALTAGVVVAAPASAAPKDPGKPMSDGAWCVQQGIGTLKALDLLQTAAKGELDYAPLGSQPGGLGFINIAFTSEQVEDGVYLSLGTVVKLHTTNLEYFDWCAARA
jgi:hypothetical protein